MQAGRRALLLGGGALALGLANPASARTHSVLDRALRRLGGRASLERVRALRWTGTAVVHAGGREVRIGVETDLEVFGTARSRSWLLSDGPAHARTMIITADGGTLERDGQTSALPAAMADHERAQYAVYGLLLLAPLRHPPARVRELPRDGGFDVLEAIRAPAPTTRLYFDPDGRFAGASNVVPNPDAQGNAAQHFTFSREVMPGPVEWPRSYRLLQDGQPYFDLALTSFEAVLRP